MHRMRNMRKHLPCRRLRNQRWQIYTIKIQRMLGLQSMRSPVSWRRNSSNRINLRLKINNAHISQQRKMRDYSLLLVNSWFFLRKNHTYFDICFSFIMQAQSSMFHRNLMIFEICSTIASSVFCSSSMFLRGIEVAMTLHISCFCYNNYVGANFELRSVIEKDAERFNIFMYISQVYFWPLTSKISTSLRAN